MPMAPERTRHPHPAVHQQIQLVDEGALGQVAVPVQVDAVRTVQFGPSAARFRTPSPVRSVCTLPCAPVFRAGVPRCWPPRSRRRPLRRPAGTAKNARVERPGRRAARPGALRAAGRTAPSALRGAAARQDSSGARHIIGRTSAPDGRAFLVARPSGRRLRRGHPALARSRLSVPSNARHARRGPVDGPVEARRLLVQRRRVDVELQQRGTGPSGCRKSTGEPGGDTEPPIDTAAGRAGTARARPRGDRRRRRRVRPGGRRRTGPECRGACGGAAGAVACGRPGLRAGRRCPCVAVVHTAASLTSAVLAEPSGCMVVARWAARSRPVGTSPGDDDPFFEDAPG